MASNMEPEDCMQAAIAEAKNSGTPYGAVIARDGEIVIRVGNTVEAGCDPTAHAEVNAIRKLTARLQTPFIEPGYTLYTTCEPCPMCAAACAWVGISEIVYGVGNDDFQEHPNLIDIRCEELVRRSPQKIAIRGGLLKAACKQLHLDLGSAATE